MAAGLAAVLALSALACGGSRYTTVTIPPRLELAGYQRAALATFTVENARGDLHELATRRFSERVLHAAAGVEVLEIGSVRPLLQQVGEPAFGPAAARIIGTDHAVPVVFSGHLKVSNVKPGGGLAGLSMPFVEATVTVDLTIGLYSTASGGTLWRAGASLSEKVGQLTMVGGEPSFSATDPNAAYGRLVDRLIAIVTRDLYPTYERRRI
jgi:hypothetical protein